jgi:hypothetical protein
MKYFVVFAVCALSLACSGGNKSSSVTEEDLEAMVLRIEQLGPTYSEYRLRENIRYPNQQVIREAPDPKTEEEALQRFSRIAGHARFYSAGRNLVGTVANLHKDAKGAAGYHRHVEQQIKSEVGKEAQNKPGLLKADFVPVSNIGDGATAALLTIQPPPPPLASTPAPAVYQTSVAFYRGPVIVTVTIEHSDQSDVREEALRLARLLDQQIQEVLKK